MCNRWSHMLGHNMHANANVSDMEGVCMGARLRVSDAYVHVTVGANQEEKPGRQDFVLRS